MSRARVGNRKLRLIVVVSAVLVLIAAALGFFSYQVQQVPQFYEQAIAATPEVQHQAAEQFEHQAIELQNQIRLQEAWHVEISADEINGWLATVLPEKFPEVLPKEVSDPRIAIEQNRVQIAAKYHTSGITTVVSIELSAFLTEQPNVVAIRIHKVAAGNVPLPLAKYLEEISAAAAEHGIFVRWQEIEGDPQAIVTLPIAEPGDKRAIFIRTLELLPGKLLATGTAEEAKRPEPEKPLPSANTQ
jgi:hypothetical protein